VRATLVSGIFRETRVLQKAVQSKRSSAKYQSSAEIHCEISTDSMGQRPECRLGQTNHGVKSKQSRRIT
jgi:hypothetical protein